ncbi:MAG: LPS export ABC transporter periplasmic protein LptC [Proteobacteria bacterium]|nr:LPS export ABC transporter periplasmic protein LptC [Pseudomonadota bacterium]
MKRFWPWVAVALTVLLLVGGGLWFRLREDVAAVAELAQNLDVDVALQRVELSQGAEGRANWRLVADKADYLKDEQLVLLDNPHIIYYQEKDGSEVNVDAPQGEVDQASGDAKLWPDVVIVSGPTTVYSDHLHYKSETRDIDLTGNIRLDRGEMQLTAPHLVMNMKTNDIKADGGVTCLLWAARPPVPAKERQQ